MYNYRQHFISEETARTLEEADARIDALNAEIREIHDGPAEWWYEAEPLYQALFEAWGVFR